MEPFLFLPRSELLRRVGNISQLAGAKRYYLADGRGFGTECVDIRTGSGLSYTVMPGRGMDIGLCEYKGLPISYISKVGLSSPSYFTGVKAQWRQCFPGGLLSTCGLGNVGSFCSDETEGIGMQDFSQHGRISNSCAEQIGVSESWNQDDYEICVTGTLHEAQLRAEHFTLHRSVSSHLGTSRIQITDTIRNEDFLDRPLMFLYHINFGYPLLDEGTRLLMKQSTLYSADVPYSEADLASKNTVGPPVHGQKERLFFYQMDSNAKTNVAALHNKKLNLLVYIRYSASSMPFMTEWKMMAESDYVLALEPGNCIPKGRLYHKEHGILPVLGAQQAITNQLEIGVIEGASQIEQFILQENLH